MEWFNEAHTQLAAAITWNYLHGGESHTEPAALTALALLRAGDPEAALPVANWLRTVQASDGSVGVHASEATPQWPTALAIRTWVEWQQATNDPRFASNVELAIQWALATSGKTMPRREGIGHDVTLRGWSWAANTHSWLEPTAMFVSALCIAGKGSHPRTVEAVRLLLDRQLPQGGFNFGNTFVLGQRMMAHVQPTGIALATLADAGVEQVRIQRSSDYLVEKCKTVRSTASLCFAALGLGAYGIRPDYFGVKLTESYRRVTNNPSIYKLALLTLAAQAILPQPTREPATSLH